MEKRSFANRVIAFNKSLDADISLPEGFSIMNPFEGNTQALELMEAFYLKFYDDNKPRKFLIGINPGRFGAGTTGIPFTDTKRLLNDCGIPNSLPNTHEPSAVFVYDMIRAYGGVEEFYADVYINSIFPLTLIRENEAGKWVNSNYYDRRTIAEELESYMVSALKTQIDFGVDTGKAFVLGKKNGLFLKKINDREKLFDELVVLEHPRYVQQYKSKTKGHYIEKYIKALKGL